MKTIIFILSWILFGWGFFSEPETKVTWDRMEHDFGIIEYKEPTSTTFIMTNVSDDSLKIDNIRTSCGCTSPIWNYDYIMPGDTTHVTIEYDSQDKGEFYKQIKVFISKQRRPERLWVYGDVLPPK